MPNIVSRIVEVIVFKMEGGQPLYLILHRSGTDTVYPGIWQIVTGQIEEGEDAVGAARREVKEETGLSASRLWRLPFVNSFYDPSHDVIHFCPHFAMLVDHEAMPILSAEHQAFEWCTIDRALTLLPWSGQRNGLKITDIQIIPDTEESRLHEIPLDPSERNLR